MIANAQGSHHVLTCLLCCCCRQAGHSVLIFCASKNWCEITAKHIAKMLSIPERSTPKSAQQVGTQP
jgi:replicative superfamily II helicase